VAEEASEEALAEEALAEASEEALEEVTDLTALVFTVRILAVGFSDRDFSDTDMEAAASEVCLASFSFP